MRNSLLRSLFLLVAAALTLGLPSDARAELIIGGCTIVSNPTDTVFTNCANADLNNANLAGIDLSFAHFHGANLSSADLSGANLQDAEMFGMTGNDIILSGANLDNADLSSSIMLRGNLSSANLTNTDLSSANLRFANLSTPSLTPIWSNTTCPDGANSDSFGSNGCLDHRTLPDIGITATANGASYSAGAWTNQNVTVHCTVEVDRTLASCSAAQSFTTEGNFTAQGTATDSVGFVSDISFGPIHIDKTAPNITASATQADSTPYTAGTWTNQNVTVSFTCADNQNGSGLATNTVAGATLSSEGANQGVTNTGACVDKAANAAAAASVGPINIDKTAPNITASATQADGTPYTAGTWTNQNVTVSFTCADNQNGSGLATNTVAGATLGSEGANQGVTNTGACVDKAANAAAAASFVKVNIDKSAPETTITVHPEDPSPLADTFIFSGADVFSGVAGFVCSLNGAPFTACTSPQRYASLAEGQNTFQVQARDAMGHVDATPASYTWSARGDLPVAADQSVTTAEESPLVITLAVSSSSVLTYTVVTLPGHGTLGGAPPTLTYTPTVDFNGADSFTFRASDGQFSSNLAIVTIGVSAVNDAPVAASQAVTTMLATPIALALAGADVDGDPLVYSVLVSPEHGTLSGAAPNLLYTPAAMFIGNDRLTFQVSDGQVTSNVADVTISVTAAPANTGSVQGTVEDPDGDAVAGAQVTLTDAKGAAAAAPIPPQTTGAEGGYQFVGVPAGDYTLTVTRDGYNPSTPVAVTVQAGKTAGVAKVILQPGMVSLHLPLISHLGAAVGTAAAEREGALYLPALMR